MQTVELLHYANLRHLRRKIGYQYCNVNQSAYHFRSKYLIMLNVHDGELNQAWSNEHQIFNKSWRWVHWLACTVHGSFAVKSAQELRKGHLWLSVFSRPPHTNFTRVQRLACCLSFLLTSMMTNIMFYGIPRVSHWADKLHLYLTTGFLKCY